MTVVNTAVSKTEITKTITTSVSVTVKNSVVINKVTIGVSMDYVRAIANKNAVILTESCHNMLTFIDIIKIALATQRLTVAQDKHGMKIKSVSVTIQNAAVESCLKTTIIVNAALIKNVAINLVIITEITIFAPHATQTKNVAQMTPGNQIQNTVHVLDVVVKIHILRMNSVRKSVLVVKRG